MRKYRIVCLGYRDLFVFPLNDTEPTQPALSSKKALIAGFWGPGASGSTNSEPNVVLREGRGVTY